MCARVSTCAFPYNSWMQSWLEMCVACKDVSLDEYSSLILMLFINIFSYCCYYFLQPLLFMFTYMFILFARHFGGVEFLLLKVISFRSL